MKTNLVLLAIGVALYIAWRWCEKQSEEYFALWSLWE